MPRHATVGVVIPTFERVHETVRAVDSALAQSAPIEQIVVVDDGSSPETVGSLSSALALYPVEVLRERHTGHPGRARNAGVAALATDWVAFLDSDDVWSPDKIERQLAVAAVEGAAAICCNARRVTGGQRGQRVVDLPAVALADLVRRNCIVNSSVLVSRSLLDEVGGVAESYLVRGTEDYATWLRIATLSAWHFVDEPLVDYTDDAAASIRGDEEFEWNPGQQAAWLDYLAWRRQRHLTTPLSQRVAFELIGEVLAREVGNGKPSMPLLKAAAGSWLQRARRSVGP